MWTCLMVTVGLAVSVKQKLCNAQFECLQETAKLCDMIGHIELVQ